MGQTIVKAPPSRRSTKSRKPRKSSKVKRQSVKILLNKKKLTKENVNDYVDDNDYEVPLYTAVFAEDADLVYAILKLEPNVFLGVEGDDQEWFQSTAIGLAYMNCAHEDKPNHAILIYMERYISDYLKESLKGYHEVSTITRDLVEKMWEQIRTPLPPRKDSVRRSTNEKIILKQSFKF